MEGRGNLHFDIPMVLLLILYLVFLSIRDTCLSTARMKGVEGEEARFVVCGGWRGLSATDCWELGRVVGELATLYTRCLLDICI
jgi:hypothetical protein